MASISKGVVETKTDEIVLSREEQVAKVLELIEQGNSENKACKEVGINRNTFRAAALRHEAADTYARALYGLAQDQVEKIETTIEDMRTGKIDSNMARVEIDTRKWFASKFLPKQYGDKIDMTSNGKELPTPIITILADKASENTQRDVIEGEIVDKVSQNAGLIQNGNIMDDING